MVGCDYLTNRHGNQISTLDNPTKKDWILMKKTWNSAVKHVDCPTNCAQEISGDFADPQPGNLGSFKS
jgi:hypothetical protein